MSGQAPPRAPVPDPDRLASAAIEHGVAGYLLAAERRGEVSLPEDARKRLRTQQALQALQAGILRRELTRVWPTVQRACEIEPVLIKGPALAERLYPQRTLRPFGDVDVVVPRARLRAAADALADQLGYTPDREPWSGYGERQGHHIAMSRRKGAMTLMVDLHWRLSDDPVAHRLDHAWLFGRGEGLAIGDACEVTVPCAEDELLVSALHLLHEQPKRLVLVNDVALAAQQASEVEWEGVFAAAHELGLGWVLDRGLDYAAHYLGLSRVRPRPAERPPAFGPLRAGESFEGWLGTQLGRLALGGWLEREGYLRSAARARRAQLRRWLTARPSR